MAAVGLFLSYVCLSMSSSVMVADAFVVDSTISITMPSADLMALIGGG
jgi:hypothetical protein